MRPDDPLYEFAKNERVSTPTSNGGSVLGRLKCWWKRRHAWIQLRAIDSGRTARVCERCGRFERMGTDTHFEFDVK